MPKGLVKPSNCIAAGENKFVEAEVGANATAAKMLPGRFVIHDAADGDVKEAGANADNALGVLAKKPEELKTTAYAVGDACLLITEGYAVITLVSGSAAVAPGDPIVTAADGKGAKQAVGAMGAQGSVVAKAQETVDPAAADKECLVKLSLQSAEPAAAA